MNDAPEPYYHRAGITIYLGDSGKLLPDLEAGSIDLVFTDPPYNVSSRDQRAKTTIGRVKRKHTITGASPDGSESYREIRRDFGEWDHDWDPAPFLAESFRLLRDGGSLIAFTSEFLMEAYVRSDLDHRCLLYWHKNNPAPNFRGNYQRAVEMAVWQTKGGKWTFNTGGATHNIFGSPILSGWRVANTSEKRVHPTQKPEAVIRAWMDVHSNPGDLVLDPYMGSGTMLRAAKDLGRRAIGIEISEEYCEAAVARLHQDALAL